MRRILVRKKHPNVGRPLACFVVFYLLGTIGGTIFLSKEYSSLFLWLSASLIGIGVFCFYYGKKSILGPLVGVIASFFVVLNLPMQQEGVMLCLQKNCTVKGVVEKINRTDYTQWVTLKSVYIKEQGKKLKSKVRLKISPDQVVTVNDTIEVEARSIEEEPQMNPSDFNKALYLKSQQVCATLEVIKWKDYKEHTTWDEHVQKVLTERLEKLFTTEKVGIIEAALLGDDSKLNENTKALYQEAGISHVLCISGFHVGVVASLMLALFTLVPLSYTPRCLCMIVGIWLYALLTGMATSTVRASIMISVALIGKCLWQEEDRLTSLALSALIILLQNPYELYMPGFQLSFMAVLGVIWCCDAQEKKEIMGEWHYPKWQKTLMIWMSVQVLTWPVIAYHFYEISFGLSLINLIIIPIFSWVIIGGWIALALSFLHISLAGMIAFLIESILTGIEQMVEEMIHWPLATLCIGRPNIGIYLLYGMLILCLGLVVGGYCKMIWLARVGIVIGCITLCSQVMLQAHLKLTYLYVGQGDCMVMEMPHYGVFIVDGGNFGKGETVENYIKYLGYDQIQGIMVSHSDSDHIGGLTELLDTRLKIHQVFLSETDESDNLNQFIKKCQEKEIPICYLEATDEVDYGCLNIKCLAPNQSITYEDGNDNSLVCRLSYGDFSALLTGDRSITQDPNIYSEIEPVTLLKVSHHGSRTGTSKAMLLNLKPRYAMISCGRANRYGHPHQEVVDLLEETGTKVSRTDIEGAICYETDGTYIKETKYRKDA